MISRRSLLAGLAVVPAVRWPAARSEPATDVVAPLVTEGTVAVIVFDLGQEPAILLASRFLARSTGGRPSAERERDLAERLRQCSAGRAIRFWLVFDLADLPGPPLLAVPVEPNEAREAMNAALLALVKETWGDPAAVAVVRGFVVAGRADAVNRLRDEVPTDRPDLRAALRGTGDNAAVRGAVSPGRSLRRAVAESLPNLPAEFGDGPVAPFIRGMDWLALSFEGDLRRGRAIIQATDPTAAGTIQRAAQLGLDAAGQALAGLPSTRDLASRVAKVRLVLDGSRVVADLDIETALALLAAPMDQVRAAIAQTEGINRLKTFGLAIDNYQHVFRSFPPAYRADPAGRPLLSWRVLILPYLDQDALFKQFRLDEPWDGPTNKPLIGRMPSSFAAPAAPPELAAAGKTLYLTPRGPDTLFPGAIGVKLGEVFREASSTILVLEAEPSAAVTWTRPDDADAAALPANLVKREWAATMGDGAARRFQAGVPPEVLRALLSRTNRDPIDWTKL